MNDTTASTAELHRLLGEADFLRLVEAYGGTRLFLPRSAAKESLTEAVSAKAAAALAERYAGSYIRVPLARELRARHYRAAGLSNAQIARRLGIAETGVDKLFDRMPNKPVKGSGDPRQADLFS